MACTTAARTTLGLFTVMLGADEECRMNCVRRSRYAGRREIMALATLQLRHACVPVGDLQPCLHHVSFNADQLPHLSATTHQHLAATSVYQ